MVRTVDRLLTSVFSLSLFCSVTAEKWVPIVEVPVNSLKLFLEKKKREGFSILGLEQTANSVSLDKYQFPKKTVSSKVFFYFSLNFPMEVKKDLVDDHCCLCCCFERFWCWVGKRKAYLWI